MFGITFQDITKPRTRVSARWLNAVQGLLSVAASGAGLTPYANFDDAEFDAYDQLSLAIRTDTVWVHNNAMSLTYDTGSLTIVNRTANYKTKGKTFYLQFFISWSAKAGSPTKIYWDLPSNLALGTSAVFVETPSSILYAVNIDANSPPRLELRRVDGGSFSSSGGIGGSFILQLA